MTLLNIYLGTIAVFYLALIGFICECVNRLKGQEITVKKSPLGLSDFLRIFLLSAAPFINLIVALMFLFSKEIMEDTLNSVPKGR